MSTTQIVISKLTSLANKGLFLQLTREMVAWLDKQPGFLAYALYENGIHLSDTLVYESDEAAERINADFRKTEVCGKMLTLVDSGYHSFFGKKVPL